VEPSPHVPGGQPALTGTDDAAPHRVPSTGGLTIALHELGGHGQGHDEPVLLVHATGFHGRVWAPCAAHLPFRSFAPDVRGHGASPLPPAAFTGDEPDPAVLSWDRVADDVLAAAEAVVALTGMGDGLLAVGHSMGGAALLLAEERRPGTFRGLYVYEPVVFPRTHVAPGTANPLAAGARRRRPRFGSRAAALANYATKPPLDALAPDALAAYVDHGLLDEAEGSVTLACTPAVEAALFAQGMHHDTFAHLGAIRCPVTVAAGGADNGPGPARAAPAVAGALPRGELVLHPDLGHFGPLEDPAAIAADITARLTG
jgi:pimeloyl-ACP methyl ester carboxylesterase